MQCWRKRLQEIGEVETFDYPYMREGRKRPADLDPFGFGSAFGNHMAARHCHELRGHQPHRAERAPIGDQS